MTPTTEERYQHMRENAEAFVQGMQAMVTAAEERGDEDMASKLRVWCLMPWQAAIEADDAGDLWPICECCEKPIKDDAERVSGDACDFHKACLGYPE
jgi:hypothetical protein